MSQARNRLAATCSGPTPRRAARAMCPTHAWSTRKSATATVTMNAGLTRSPSRITPPGCFPSPRADLRELLESRRKLDNPELPADLVGLPK